MSILFIKTKIFPIALFACCFFVFANETQAYDPPIGIPEPDFGIEQSNSIYIGQRFDFDGDGTLEEGEEYRDIGNGPYTHYVDSTDPASTDTNNLFGTPALPRKSVPAILPAGAVVEVHNNAIANGWGEFGIGGVGTIKKPIFVRGIDKPRILSPFDIGYYRSAQYIIVEGFEFLNGTIVGRQDGTAFVTSYISLRNCEMQGNVTQGGVGVTSWSSNSLNNIVLYHNVIHDNGEWDPLTATGDQDVHGIAVGTRVSYMWVLDNEMYHNSGDGIQINGGSLQNMTHHIYVGRNNSHHNKQSGLWTKQAVDVVFSENKAYGHRKSSSSNGTGMGFQYGPERVWFIGNDIYDNEFGITLGSNSGGVGTESYFIGNIIHDIHYDPVYHNNSYDAYNANLGSAWSNSAMMMAGGKNRFIVGNTIYDVNAGINIPGSGSAYIANNIIAKINTGVESHIWAEAGSPLSGGTFDLKANNNVLYQSSGGGKIRDYNKIYNTSTLPASLGSSNIETDPSFISSETVNFRLQPSSPAVDKGIASDVYQTFQNLYGLDIRLDREHASRPQGSAWDIGAYEYATSTIPSPSMPRGDVNTSGAIDSTDGMLILRKSLGLQMSNLSWNPASTTGDVNCDGAISASDALLVLRYSIGLDMAATAWCDTD